MKIILILLISLLPGLLNCIQAVYVLLRSNPKIKGLIFFNPLKSKGFIVWIVSQFIIPSLSFYFLFLHNKEVESNFIVSSIVFGIGFIGVVNSTTYFGPFTVNIKSIYDIFLRVAFWMIENEQEKDNKTAIFWSSFRHELQAIPLSDLINGLNQLVFYIQSQKKRLLYNPQGHLEF